MIDYVSETKRGKSILLWVVTMHSINTQMVYSINMAKHAPQILISQVFLSKHNCKIVHSQVIARLRDPPPKPQYWKCTRTQWGNCRLSVTSRQPKHEKRSKKRSDLKISSLDIDKKALMLNAFKRSMFMKKSLRNTSMKPYQSTGTWFKGKMN